MRQRTPSLENENLARVLPQLPGAKEKFADNDARAQAATFNASLQAGYYIIAARAAGLDAGPMGGFDKAGIDTETGRNPRNPRLEHHEAVTVL